MALIWEWTGRVYAGRTWGGFAIATVWEDSGQWWWSVPGVERTADGLTHALQLAESAVANMSADVA
jgi:hypothetical protein